MFYVVLPDRDILKHRCPVYRSPSPVLAPMQRQTDVLAGVIDAPEDSNITGWALPTGDMRAQARHHSAHLVE